MNRSSISIFAWLALGGMAVFAIYYPYKFVTGLASIDFTGPTTWQMFYIVEDGIQVPLSARIGHFLAWVPTALATQVSIVASMLMVWRVIQQSYLHNGTIKILQWAGGAAAVAAFTALVAASLEAWMLTRFNTDNQFPVQLRIESGEMGVLLAGIGVFMLGWVIRIALDLDGENREIV